MEQTIDCREAARLIHNSKGKLFSVLFTKRTTGSTRRMVGRIGVRKGVTGTGPNYNAKDHDLIRVHEFVTAEDTLRNPKGHFVGGGNLQTQWRAVPIEGIQELRLGGKTYRVQ